MTLSQTSSMHSAYLFVLPWSLKSLGGVNQVVIGLALEMLRAGTYEPIVLIADWSATEPVWEEVHGLRTVRWRIRSCLPGAGVRERLVFWWWQRRFGPAFQRFCKEQRVAVVNPHYPEPAVFTLERISRRIKPGVVWLLSYHGADLQGLRALSAPTMALWSALLRRVDGAVVCSRDLGHRFAEIFVDPAPAQVIHNGLDTPALIAASCTVLEAAPGRTILNVAKFEHKKGQDVLIQAFARIARTYPDIRLRLVGAPADALESLQAMCRECGVEQKVQFLLNVPHAQIGQLFRQASIFAVPSRAEPFGIVLLEAGAFCLPVVASRVGGIPEIVEDGVHGLLVPPDDVEALARRLSQLLDAPAEAQAMADRLHQRVTSEFTWEAAHRKYVAFAKGRPTGDKIEG